MDCVVCVFMTYNRSSWGLSEYSTLNGESDAYIEEVQNVRNYRNRR